MSTYQWHGINAAGKRVSGSMEATTKRTLLTELRQQAITPLTVRKKTFAWRYNPKISKQHLLDFSRQLSLLLNAGISLAPALKIMQQSETQSAMKKLTNNIKIGVESGEAFYEILSQFPQYFDSLYCNLVMVGEQTGNLQLILQEITRHQEKIAQLNNKIKKALIYPGAVVTVALLVIAVLLIFVIPQFQKIFQDFGAALPLYTQFVIGLASKIKYLPLIILGVTLAGWAAWRWTKKRNHLDGLLLRLPGLGNILRKNIFARFTRTFSITCNANIPIPEALAMVAHSSGNFIYTQALLQIQRQVSHGQTIHLAMQQTQLFPARMTQMIAIAEETGNLATVLAKLADFYEFRVETAAENFTKLLEPAIMFILGIVIGGLILAMYLPIFRLGSAI